MQSVSSVNPIIHSSQYHSLGQTWIQIMKATGKYLLNGYNFPFEAIPVIQPPIGWCLSGDIEVLGHVC